LGLAFRLACALPFSQPVYSDAYYYSNIAEFLWQGRGFHEDFLWNYLARPLPDSPLNNPSSTYWMPLTSVLIYLSYLVTGGPSFRAAQLPNILISSALVPLTYYVVKDILPLKQKEFYAWVSAGLMIFCGYYAPYFSLPDNFAPFALLTLLALICQYKTLRLSLSEKRRGLALMAGAGICTGLSYLTRVDGVLLLVVAFLIIGLNSYWLKRESAMTWTAFGLMCLTFALTLLPWLGRSLSDTGQLFPGGGTKTLFMREYNDLFTYTKPLDLAYYLNQTNPDPNWGIGPLLFSKLDALFQNLLIVGRGTLIFMSPFFLIGIFAKVTEKAIRNSGKERPLFLGLTPEFLPFSVYLTALYLAMSLLFTFPGTRGSVFHSGGGLLPFIYAVTFMGLDRFIDWLGTKSRPKAGASRRRVYSLIFLFAAAIFSVVSPLNLASSQDAQDYDQLKAVGTWLEANGAGDAPLMVPDVPAYYYATHKPAVVITSDPLPVNLEIARRYGARYFVLQPNHAPAALAELAEKKSAPGFRLIGQIGEIQLYRLEY
jgi:hypothetical protein